MAVIVVVVVRWVAVAGVDIVVVVVVIHWLLVRVVVSLLSDGRSAGVAFAPASPGHLLNVSLDTYYVHQCISQRQIKTDICSPNSAYLATGGGSCCYPHSGGCWPPISCYGGGTAVVAVVVCTVMLVVVTVVTTVTSWG